MENIANNFITAINSFAWKHDFYQFCNLLKLNADENDEYAVRQWKQFQETVKGLRQLDNASWQKIVDFHNNA